MAENEVDESVAKTGKKSSKKMVIIIIVVAILAIGISVGVTIFLLGGKDTPKEAAATTKPAVSINKEAIFYDITATNSPVIVTFNVKGRQRYMQAFITAMTRDKSVADALEEYKPVIRSRIIALYGSQNFGKLRTNAGKEALRKATLDTVNKVLAAEKVKGKVDQILFTNFVMQ